MLQAPGGVCSNGTVPALALLVQAIALHFKIGRAFHMHACDHLPLKARERMSDEI